MKNNIMNQIRIEKIILSISGTGDVLERGVKLLKLLTGKKPAKMKSHKRIPAFSVRPGLEVGALVTIRDNKEEFLRKLLAAKDNILEKKQFNDNSFTFGIKEYIEIPGIEYDREVGILGLDVTVVFTNTGKRVKLKKIKRGKIPIRKRVSKEEIIKYMEEKFNTEFN